MDACWAAEPEGPAGPGLPADRRRDAARLSFDVVVFGGGPAGMAAALALSRLGRRVAIFARARRPSPRGGESLPPEVRAPLAALGLWESFRRAKPAASAGLVSSWGRAEPSEADFVANPFGCGWHVDRQAFDAMMARGAHEAGATVISFRGPISFASTPSLGWRIDVPVPEGCLRVRAPAVIDATGRASWFARRLGARRVADDRLVGLVARIPAAAPRCDRDGRALVESGPDGWWYTAPLPSGEYAAAFFTDSDLMPRGRARARYWKDRLVGAPLTASRLCCAGLGAEPRAVDARSSWLDRAAGGGWLAAGDAAASLDPLSSLGVYRALVTGIEAGRALDVYLRGDGRALEGHASRVATDYAEHQRERSAYYAIERRWPTSPFWRRRHPG